MIAEISVVTFPLLNLISFAPVVFKCLKNLKEASVEFVGLISNAHALA